MCAGVLEGDFFLTKCWKIEHSFEVPEGVSLADLQEVELGIGILTDLQFTEDWFLSGGPFCVDVAYRPDTRWLSL